MLPLRAHLHQPAYCAREEELLAVAAASMVQRDEVEVSGDQRQYEPVAAPPSLAARAWSVLRHQDPRAFLVKAARRGR